MKTFTIHQSYRLMFKFLVSRWEDNKERYDDLPLLLGSMQLARDGKPIDEALWYDWLKATTKGSSEVLTAKEMLASVLRFLRNQPWDEITCLADELEALGEKSWTEWVCEMVDADDLSCG